MHNPESVLENETHEALLNFETQTDHLISARRPDLVILNKKKWTCRIVDFELQADHRLKFLKTEKRDEYLDIAWELKKQWNMQVTVMPIVVRALGTIPEELVKVLEDLETRGQIKDHQDYRITKIGQNTEKSPGDWRGLAVT